MEEEQGEDNAASADLEMRATASVHFCGFMACKTSCFPPQDVEQGQTQGSKPHAGFTVLLIPRLKDGASQNVKKRPLTEATSWRVKQKRLCASACGTF